VIQRFEYHPFGQEKYVLNPTLEFQPSYTDQHYDIETGLYYYKSRYYDPQLSRFIQPDSIVPDPMNTQAMNRYAYVVNNPVNFIDPSGHSFWRWANKFVSGFLAGLAGAAVFVVSGGNAVLAAMVGGAIYGASQGAITGAVVGTSVQNPE
jgi:RHS repeat-associated protein